MTKYQLASAVCESLRKEREPGNTGFSAEEIRKQYAAGDATDAALAAWSAAPDEVDELAEAREIIAALLIGCAANLKRRAQRWLARNGGAN